MSSTYGKALLIEEMIKQAESQGLSSQVQATLAGVIENCLYPELREHILELHDRHHGREVEAFDRDVELHKEIVSMLNQIGNYSYSTNDILWFKGLEQRRIEPERIRALAHEVEELDKMSVSIKGRIKQIRPFINVGTAEQYLPSARDFSQKDCHYDSGLALALVKWVRMDGEESDYYTRQVEFNERNVNINFLELLGMEASLERHYQERRRQLSWLRQNHIDLSSGEGQELHQFKHDRHHTYRSIYYSWSYCQWRIQALGNIRLPTLPLEMTIRFR